MADINYNKSAFIGLIVILGLIATGSVVFLVFTSLIWTPLLILNLPILIIIFLLLKYTKLGNPIKNFWYKIYDWIFYKSEKPRQFMWQSMYDTMCWIYPLTRWRVMNYGYALLNDDGKLITNLSQEDEDERFCLQLYHYIASSFNSNRNLNGLSVLEVGSGRGGGLDYVSRYLKPKECVGVDFSPNQVKFCQSTYASNPNISFYQGNSENLDAIKELKEQSFDLVINIESSHCYGNFKEFVRQVDKVLKVGGHFIITDFREKYEVEELEKDLQSFNMKISKKEDISINVLHSLKIDEKRRSSIIENNVNFLIKPLARKFTGLQGTRINNGMMNKETLYLAYILKKH